MEATRTAAELLEAVPANATLGLRVLTAVDGVGEVEMHPAPEFGNVIGSLHASGLIGLVDASCLAAVISSAARPEDLTGVVPLGTNARLRFRAPARGRLVGRCEIPVEVRDSLRTSFATTGGRMTLETAAEIVDESAQCVCSGAFTWSIKKVAQRARSGMPRQNR